VVGSVPLFPIVFSLHLRQTGNRPVKGKDFLFAAEHTGVEGTLVLDLDAKVVDEHPVGFHLLLLGDCLGLKQVPIVGGPSDPYFYKLWVVIAQLLLPATLC